MAIDVTIRGTNIHSTGLVIQEAPKTKIGFRPLGDRILVKETEAADEIQNGLVIPDVAKERPLEGVVLAVGNGRVHNGERIPLDIQVGQRIAFGRYSGNELKVSGQKLLLLNESEVHGYYEE